MDPVTFEGMENLLRPVIVVGGSVVLTVLIGWATDRLLSKADRRHPETPMWGLLRRGRIPYQLVLCAAMLRGSYDEAQLLEDHRTGIGQALTEGCHYDKNSGQLVTGSYLDYCMPRADDVPNFKVGTKETPCTHNPLGVKG